MFKRLKIGVNSCETSQSILGLDFKVLDERAGNMRIPFKKTPLL